MKRSEQKLRDVLKLKKLNIALAESVTCGMVSNKLATVSDTSKIFMGGIVCYDEKVKINLLSVRKTLIKKYSAESQQVTDALCKNLKKLIKADVYAAVTGLASPGGSETKQKPVGAIFFSIIYKGVLHQKRNIFRGTPLEIRKKSCEKLFSLITKIISN